MHRIASIFVAVVVCSCAGVSRAQWTSIGNGIDYQQFRVTNPDNDVYVARMVVTNPSAIIESSIANDRVAGAMETVRSQATRQNDTISAWGGTWGQRNGVVVAVNGSFYNTTTGVITGGDIFSGWYAKRFDQFSGQTGFVWKRDRSYFIGGCPQTKAGQQIITWTAGGSTQQINGVNVARGTDQMILYTPQYDSNTHTDNTGSEVLVQMTSPASLTAAGVTGTVREIHTNTGSSLIPFDYVVLSANGTAATTLLNKAQVGATLKIGQTVTHYLVDCSTSNPLSFENSFALSQGNHVFLRNSVVIPNSDAGYTTPNPRTAVAINASYIFFIVVDGRSTRSAGMTITQLGDFALNTLGATDATNQDGGGSSTMVVNGVVQNVPSDGVERAVANGLMMVNVQPKLQSTLFSSGQTTSAAGSTSYRLGPGTNFYAPGSIASGAQGTILTHSLNGVFAKGDYWWMCDFSGMKGWVPQSTLAGGTSPPTITQQPVDQTAVVGGTASFSIQAQSVTSLTYRWQRNQVDLSDGGALSGTLTATLTITGADGATAGAYRCVVTNSAGSVASDEANLVVRLPDFDHDGDVDLADFAHLQICLGTTNVAGVPACQDTDLDGDAHVNTSDLALFLPCLAGADQAGTAHCVIVP